MILMGKLKNLEKNPFQCHFVRQKYHKGCPVCELGIQGGRAVTNHLSYGVAKRRFQV
jgi:hypothetical protein